MLCFKYWPNLTIPCHENPFLCIIAEDRNRSHAVHSRKASSFCPWRDKMDSIFVISGKKQSLQESNYNSPTGSEGENTCSGMWKRGIAMHKPSRHCICYFSSVCYLQAGIHMPPHIPPLNTQKPISRFHNSLRIRYKPENEWRISTRTGRVCHEWRYSVICFSHTSAMPLNWI